MAGEFSGFESWSGLITLVKRRFSRPETHSQWTGSRVLEDHWEIVQPRNGYAPFVKAGFAQDGVVRPLVEAHDNAVSVHFEQAAGFHKLGPVRTKLSPAAK
jgi:hypothetical protein